MRYLFWGFMALYLAAMALLAIGTFGLFGQEPDPLAGVFLMPLGLPWNLLALKFPAIASPALGILAPLINAGILYWLWKR